MRASRRDGLLRAHHDRVDEAAEEHEQRQHDVHDADTLVVDRREPIAPEITPISLQRDPPEHAADEEHHERRRAHDDRLVERDRAQAQFAQEIHFSVLCAVE